MIDVNLVLENPEIITKAAADKGVKLDAEALAVKVNAYKDVFVSVQKLREERNKFTKVVSTAKPDERQKLIEEGKKLKVTLDKKEEELKKLHDAIHPLLLTIPNPAKPDVKVGKNDTENDVIRKYKEPKVFDFPVKDHLALGEALDIIDMERAAKVSGARFSYLKGDAVLLELALVRYAFDFLMAEGFIPVFPPVLIKREIMEGLGYMENGGAEDMFSIPSDDLVLVGTAEQSLVPMHMGEVFSKKELPKRYVGYSSSFRREAGSYGKDTRGILRVHQFNKVEMVSYVAQGEDDKEHEYMLSLEEKFFQALDIPYQVIKMCTGDLGFPAARKYDIEAWMPGQNKYREVTSTSTCTDFQARRLNIRYQDGDERKFVNILNGTGFAMSRTPIAIMENYQQEDGSIVVPEVLRKYLGKDVIAARTK
jgi:seryl-tRNA synthetase